MFCCGLGYNTMNIYIYIFFFFPLDEDGGSDQESALDPDRCEPAEALRLAGEMLIDLKWAGTLSAIQVCTLCFWLEKAGNGGLIKKLAVHPDRSSGQYSKHFDLIVGTRRCDTDGDYYIMQSPCYLRSQARRSVEPLEVSTPLEAIEEEIRTTPNINERLASMTAAGDFPDAYFEHPVKQRAPPNTNVFPYVLYIDGIAFQRTDGLLRFSVISLVTGISHLNVALRKSELCACGCKGWCTIFGVMLMLHWSFESLARGRWFQSRHDSTDWLPSDHQRAARAGNPLGFIALLLFTKEAILERNHALEPTFSLRQEGSPKIKTQL